MSSFGSTPASVTKTTEGGDRFTVDVREDGKARRIPCRNAEEQDRVYRRELERLKVAGKL